MNYPATLIITALVCSTAVAAPEPVTCDSPCDCQNAHDEGLWSVKTDASLPPTDVSAIQAVTPSEMFSWPGPDAALTMQSERTGIENKWYALKGRVVELKVEADGDLHITVIGKAFWDVGHAPKGQSNRRKYMPDYAVWEIHPVMKLTAQ